MALTVTNVVSGNSKGYKQSVIEVTFDTSYPTGGETLDLSTAGSLDTNGFGTVYACGLIEGPYTTAGVPIAQTLCSKVQYDFATSRAVATGLLFALAEDGTSGVTTQVANTTDLSTVVCRLLVIGL